MKLLFFVENKDQISKSKQNLFQAQIDKLRENFTRNRSWCFRQNNPKIHQTEKREGSIERIKSLIARKKTLVHQRNQMILQDTSDIDSFLELN